MGRGQRLGLIAVAAVIAVVAFIALRPSNDDESDSTSQTTTTAAEQAPAPEPKPGVKKIVLVGGKVKGGEQKITVEKDDTARFDVRSDAAEELHLHGYDVTKEVAAGGVAEFRVKANIEGVFEIEAHDLGHVIIAQLVVEP